MDNAKLMVFTTSNDIIPVRKYVLKSGLTVVLAATEGPLVSGFFCICKYGGDNVRIFITNVAYFMHNNL